MSKFIEYLKLLPKGLANADKVLEGIVNEVKSTLEVLPEDQQEEIIRRRVICNACPLNSINAKQSEEYRQLYGRYYETDRTDLHCSCCSCNVNLKSSSLASSCGLETYNQEIPENKQPLKWEKYIKTPKPE